MVSGNMIGHSGYGGQFLAINLKTGKTFQSGSIDEELMKKSFNL